MSLLDNELFAKDINMYIMRYQAFTYMNDMFDQWLEIFLAEQAAPLGEGMLYLVGACESAMLYNDSMLAIWTRLKNADLSKEPVELVELKEQIIEASIGFAVKHGLEDPSPESYFVNSLHYLQRFWVKGANIFRLSLNSLNDESSKSTLNKLDEIEEMLFPTIDRDAIINELKEADLLLTEEDIEAYIP